MFLEYDMSGVFGSSLGEFAELLTCRPTIGIDAKMQKQTTHPLLSMYSRNLNPSMTMI